MYITTIPDKDIIALQRQMNKNKINYLIISASVIETTCQLAYRILIFQESQKEKDELS